MAVCPLSARQSDGGLQLESVERSQQIDIQL